MTWLWRLGAIGALLGALACTGNPKPLPPGTVDDSGVQADGQVNFDAGNGDPDAMVSDGSINDGGDAGDGAIEGGMDGALDGGAVDGGAVDGGTSDGSIDSATHPQLDAGPFPPEGGVNRKDGGPDIPPPGFDD